MYGLKLCDLEDTEIVADFVLQFCEESYSHLPPDTEKVLGLVTHFLSDESRLTRVVIGLTKDNDLVGILAGTSQEAIFSRSLVANEMMFWVLPDHRNRHSLKMVKAFEYWAKKVGCVNVHLSNVKGTKLAGLDKLYKRLGYELLEQAHVKVI
jgi:hypothetical protein